MIEHLTMSLESFRWERIPEKHFDWPALVTCLNLNQSLRLEEWDTVIGSLWSCGLI